MKCLSLDLFRSPESQQGIFLVGMTPKYGMDEFLKTKPSPDPILLLPSVRFWP